MADKMCKKRSLGHQNIGYIHSKAKPPAHILTNQYFSEALACAEHEMEL